MPAVSVIAIIAIVVVVLLLGLAVGGAIAGGRRADAAQKRLRDRLDAANELLAHAHADDKGWDRATMEAAAREAFAAKAGGAPIDELHLVHVVDKPGTDDDEARFQVVAAGVETEVVLGRRGDTWIAR
jgi:Flp pilus assembly protein TadG